MVAHGLTPFTLAVSEGDLNDLRDRLRRARWPEREPIPNWSQGVPLAYMQALCAYWAEQYDWRATEARLNAIHSSGWKSTDSISTFCTSGRRIHRRCRWC